ncbi:MAG TPA: hypothetical protein VFU04_03815, partial [Solirubrobacterales bacterium]|nr:hypothetical protein [Solirubrobacterales bacterium]
PPMPLRTTFRSLLRIAQRDSGSATLDPAVQQARAAVLLGGLPEQVARAAERRGEVDWRPLAAAMDTLFMATGSGLGVRKFWLSPQDSLSGRAPIEVLPRKDGPRQVEEAAYRASARAASSRAQ